jgi:hypothetical protein
VLASRRPKTLGKSLAIVLLVLIAVIVWIEWQSPPPRQPATHVPSGADEKFWPTIIGATVLFTLASWAVRGVIAFRRLQRTGAVTPSARFALVWRCLLAIAACVDVAVVSSRWRVWALAATAVWIAPGLLLLRWEARCAGVPLLRAVGTVALAAVVSALGVGYAAPYLARAGVRTPVLFGLRPVIDVVMWGAVLVGTLAALVPRLWRRRGAPD